MSIAYPIDATDTKVKPNCCELVLNTNRSIWVIAFLFMSLKWNYIFTASSKIIDIAIKYVSTIRYVERNERYYVLKYVT